MTNLLETASVVLHTLSDEALLTAVVGIAIIGVDNLSLDIQWLLSRHRTAPLPAARPLEGTIAVFLPAWDEASVISQTIATALDKWSGEDVRLYIGCYPNDLSTIAAIQPFLRRDGWVRMVLNPRCGTTTKADNLNAMWAAMLEDEQAENIRFAAVVLHDAEDEVHAGEIALYRDYLPGRNVVQIPVVAQAQASRWGIAEHYCDEFAEAHGKDMPLRSLFGSCLPTSGTGCAFSRDILGELANERGGELFRNDSLTEDYEMGIILSQRKGGAAFVDIRDEHGSRIAVHSDFPNDIVAAVRQKSRWIAGIAFLAWEHLGWYWNVEQAVTSKDAKGYAHSLRYLLQRLLCYWMLWRDRRPLFVAIFVIISYLSIVLHLLSAAVFSYFDGYDTHLANPLHEDSLLIFSLQVCLALLVWRVAFRVYFAWRTYGVLAAIMSVPRIFISNVVLILASFRAVRVYKQVKQSKQVVWDKTEHRPHGHTKASVGASAGTMVSDSSLGTALGSGARAAVRG